MALVLDTADMASADRKDAVRSVVERMSVPTTVSFVGPATSTSRMDAWQIGVVSGLRHEGQPMRLRRTSRHVRQDAPEVVSLMVQLRGRSLHEQYDQLHETGVGHLVMADLTGSYRSETGEATLATYVSYADLQLGVDVGRQAMHRLRASPLYDLVRHHLMQVGKHAGTEDRAVAASVGSATVDLVRGLLLSAATEPREHDVAHETLEARIEAHVRGHLGDPELSPSSVAGALHVSVRALHKAWSVRETTLMDWVTQERLAGARRDLAQAHGAFTVAATARRWGFSDPAHFTRRFRAAYGIPPSEWRRSRQATRTCAPAAEESEA